MALEPDLMHDRASEVLRRTDTREMRVARGTMQREAYRRRRQRTVDRLKGKAKRMAIALATIWAATIVWGLVFSPIGTSILSLITLATMVLLVMLAIFPKPPFVPTDRLADAPPSALPAKTDLWLERQRLSLPRLAAPQVDAISARLATLEVQLAEVPAADPVAQDLSRLLGKHLPELVERYTRVPPDQRSRTIEGDGRTLEKSLVDGLAVVETELGRASDRLAAADRDAFVVQGKFIESRYNEPGA